MNCARVGVAGLKLISRTLGLRYISKVTGYVRSVCPEAGRQSRGKRKEKSPGKERANIHRILFPADSTTAATETLGFYLFVALILLRGRRHDHSLWALWGLDANAVS